MYLDFYEKYFVVKNKIIANNCKLRISGSWLLLILSLTSPRAILVSLTSPKSQFDIKKLWRKNGVFDEIFGCTGP